MTLSNSGQDIAVCIATYKRPIGLQRLLNSLGNLVFTKIAEPDWHVIVVDNDLEGSALSVIKEISPSFPVPIEYCIEHTKGIASARNKAVRLAKGVDFVAFIDDDEFAESNWLDELLCIQNEYHADVVQGPVLPKFEQKPKKWITFGEFFSRPRYVTGTKLKYSATGNLLIKNKWLHAFEGPFDLRMNLTGGTDTLFSSKIYQLGAIGVWADDAIVYEYVPKSRAKASWILKRKWRSGITLSLTERFMDKSIFVKILRLSKGIANIVISMIMIFPNLLIFGNAGLIKSIGRLVFGLGEILGLFGIKFYEYE